jgi:hypothetical protein
MAINAYIYGLALESLANKEINWASDTIKVMLCTSAYTPNQDTHRYKSDITNEVTGTAYTATGYTLVSKTVTYTAGTNTMSLDAADVSWPASTITARYAIIYDASPATDATRPLIAYVDFGADVVSSGSTFLIQWDGNGIITGVC